MAEKRCNRCKTMLDKGMFYKDNTAKSGYQSCCKTCKSEMIAHGAGTYKDKMMVAADDAIKARGALVRTEKLLNTHTTCKVSEILPDLTKIVAEGMGEVEQKPQ